MAELSQELNSSFFIKALNVEKEKLFLIEQILNAFHAAHISYCHWKSNEHLAASMTGDTDLDILFDVKQKETLLPILQNFGFRYFKSIAQKNYNGIEDYIGLDHASGKIVHLHAHFKLTLGEAYLKSYQLDIAESILDRRIYSAYYGIYCIDPAFEYVLLFIRLALKMRLRDVLSIHFKGNIDYTGNLLDEYYWLKDQCTKEEIAHVVQLLFKQSQPIYNLLTGDFNKRQIQQLSPLVKREFKRFRQYPDWQAKLMKWYREVSFLCIRKFNKWFNLTIIKQRINPNGGICIALIGADGSGKSTVRKALYETFSKKIDVYTIYFGKGSSGKMSASRKLLKNVKQVARPVSTFSNTQPAKPKNAGNNNFLKDLFEALQALAVAKEKQNNLKRTKVLVKNGAMVICDRFPQNQINGYNDGPALARFLVSRNPLLKHIARLELKAYQLAELNPPHLVFKLITDLQTAELRKPNGTPANLLQAKINGIEMVQFSISCKVIKVDATQPIETVLKEIKKAIWMAIP